jgi:hypothetical protein
MKLWLCESKGVEQSPFILLVAETEEKAINKFKKLLDNDYVEYYSVSARVIEVVDGYGIEVVS